MFNHRHLLLQLVCVWDHLWYPATRLGCFDAHTPSCWPSNSPIPSMNLLPSIRIIIIMGCEPIPWYVSGQEGDGWHVKCRSCHDWVSMRAMRPSWLNGVFSRWQASLSPTFLMSRNSSLPSSFLKITLGSSHNAIDSFEGRRSRSSARRMKFFLLLRCSLVMGYRGKGQIVLFDT